MKRLAMTVCCLAAMGFSDAASARVTTRVKAAAVGAVGGAVVAGPVGAVVGGVGGAVVGNRMMHRRHYSARHHRRHR